ncbi:UdgX family uracil-DNA binding protein [Paeniroseomonas aquatica]|uniref:Type-4 uracil-DNA glycosylase n=1 Tax=Paeniroseomonas aquatica TaxID=373043 RepID=A0ABT8A6Z1_9PROT|nr:UdgX family uracil-DNA binding protein [Paeniroseomonas aquatica]MDN3565569.1 UdgX family uracil-DNA binding protein [Paeniroseomonas aquatica]
MIDAALDGPADFAGRRAAARRLVAAKPAPEGVARALAGEAPGLFGAAPPPPPQAGRAAASVPRGFLDLAEVAIRHRDPERFALLYRLLWRLTHGEAGLLQVATDPEVIRAQAMAKAVRRDAHKLHAFLRFRMLETESGTRYIAWFEPDHHILEAETGFFIRRFAGMRWSILTPEASAHWDGEAVRMGPGGRRADAPAEDAQEVLWRAYYAHIFNPARLKPAAMRAEMPKKYWRNLPEAQDIARLMAEAPRRVAEMVERGATPAAARRQRAVVADVEAAMPDLFSQDPAQALAALRAEVLADRGPLAVQATQAVFGEGPIGAALLFVGEQPGDEEDIAGRPFVGPAGRMFNRALEEAGVPREEAYVTNAVKHFKFTPTGRRRLHQTPDAGDITHYRPFLRREVEIVAPRLVVSLGATALRALVGKATAISKVRGEVIRTEDGQPLFPTVHPSYLLRLPDAESKAREYARFVADLKAAWREVQ